MVDAGGLRLCVDREDGEDHRTGGGDPVIGLLVRDVAATLSALAARGVVADQGPVAGTRGAWARLRDPDGHTLVITEAE